MIFGSFFTSFVNYLYHLIMGRLLEPANYGVLASIISLVGLLSLLPISIGLAVTKTVASAKRKTLINKKVYFLNKQVLILSLIFFVILLLLSPFISQFLKVQELLLVVGLVVFLFSFSVNFLRAILQGLLKFKQMVVSQMLENLVRLFGAIALVAAGFSVLGGLFGLVLGILAGLVLAWIFVKDFFNEPKRQNQKISLPTTISQTLPFFLLSVSITSLYSSDLILVKHFYSAADAGVYAAMSFLGRIIFFAVSPITAVMFPIVSRTPMNGGRSLPVLKWSMFGAFLISLFITAVYLFVPDFVIGQLYGEKYLSESYLLVSFGIFMTLVTLSFMLLNYELAVGRYKTVVISLAAAVLQIVFIWFYHSTLTSVVFVSMAISLFLFIYLIFDTFILSFRGNKRYEYS